VGFGIIGVDMAGWGIMGVAIGTGFCIGIGAIGA
jgi:hypothetical protein